MSTNEYDLWQCCRWHRTGGSGLRICNDRDARSLTGEPMPPFALFAPSPTLRTYEQGVADERAAVVAWLREVHAKYRSTKVGITSYGSVAQDIERGSHRADSKAAEVNRDQRDDGAQAQPAGAAAAPTGQAGGEQSSPAGPPAGLRPPSPLESRFWKRGDGHLLLLVPGGITPEDLRAEGFPDVAARLEGGPRG